MVEINNQRKAFLDMLAWSEGPITDVSVWNHGYDVIVGGEPFTDYSDHPRKLVTLNPKLKSGADGYQLFSCWWDALPQAVYLKDFSPKSQDAVALQQIKERGALPMIDRAGYPSGTDRCSNIWASLPGAGYGCLSKADSLIAKFSEAGGTVREIDVWAESPRLSPPAICIVCLSWAVNHYRDNAITYKAQRQKMLRELKLANAAITDMQMRQRDVAALDAKYTKELGWC